MKYEIVCPHCEKKAIYSYGESVRTIDLAEVKDQIGGHLVHLFWSCKFCEEELQGTYLYKRAK